MIMRNGQAKLNADELVTAFKGLMLVNSIYIKSGEFSKITNFLVEIISILVEIARR